MYSGIDMPDSKSMDLAAFLLDARRSGPARGDFSMESLKRYQNLAVARYALIPCDGATLQSRIAGAFMTGTVNCKPSAGPPLNRVLACRSLRRPN